MDSVLDSSRYFVIRVEDAGKKAFIGIGFAERSESFDFSKSEHYFHTLIAHSTLSDVALQDYTKRWRKAREPPSPADALSPHLPPGPKKDYSLKEGQTFTISIPGKVGSASNKSQASLLQGSNTEGGIPLLPPPPSSSRR